MFWYDVLAAFFCMGSLASSFLSLSLGGNPGHGRENKKLNGSGSRLQQSRAIMQHPVCTRAPEPLSRLQPCDIPVLTQLDIIDDDFVLLVPPSAHALVYDCFLCGHPMADPEVARRCACPARACHRKCLALHSLLQQSGGKTCKVCRVFLPDPAGLLTDMVLGDRPDRRELMKEAKAVACDVSTLYNYCTPPWQGGVKQEVFREGVLRVDELVTFDVLMRDVERHVKYAPNGIAVELHCRVLDTAVVFRNATEEDFRKFLLCVRLGFAGDRRLVARFQRPDGGRMRRSPFACAFGALRRPPPLQGTAIYARGFCCA